MKLGIYCAGGMVGRESFDLATRLNACNSRWEDVFFISDVEIEERFYRIDELNPSDVEIVIAHGTPRYRREIFDRAASRGFKFRTLIDPSASISPTSKIGRGVLIFQNVIVSSNAIIDDNTAIQQSTVIGHDDSIGKNCVFGLNAVLSGNVSIGDESFIGVNASIREKISVGDRTIVGMGSVVIRSIENDLVVVGNPARELRKNLDGKVY